MKADKGAASAVPKGGAQRPTLTAAGACGRRERACPRPTSSGTPRRGGLAPSLAPKQRRPEKWLLTEQVATGKPRLISKGFNVHDADARSGHSPLIQARLGHTDIRMTLNLYAGVPPG